METLSTKVPARLKREVTEYADGIGETRSVATRQLLRDGLDAQGESIPMYQWVAWFGSLLLASLLTPSSASLSSIIGAVGLLLFIVGLGWPAIRPRLPFVIRPAVS